VDIGGLKKSEGPAAQIQALTVLYRPEARIDLIEGFNQFNALGGGNNLGFGAFFPELPEPARVIRLQMVQNKVIHIGKLHPDRGQGLFRLACRAGPVPEKVDEGYIGPLPLPFYQVRIEGNPLRYGPNPLKKVRRLYIRVNTINKISNSVSFHQITCSPA
jgi:hypothetical protein